MCENRVPAQPPVFGLRVVNRDCLTPQGFSPERLDTVYAELANSAHGFDMLMESASFGEVDSYYNPGEEEVSPDFILEAIVVDRFSQTERRMSAVVRIFNRFLSGSEIKALLPVVGKPRKTGAYAYVTVQIPFSDGQTVSVVFHSPEGDKKKIAANDTIIAFQWLLNRRDITHVVAPENGTEISLDELSKKITQLVVKNSARFERMQKDAAEERKTLDDTRKAVEDAEDKQRDLMSAIASASSESDTVDAKLSNTLSLLEKQKGINAELQAKLEALENAQSAGGGTGGGDIVAKFNAMVAEAARWRGAVMKVAGIVKDDRRTAMDVMRMTTKGDLDAYLMKKFGIDSATARSVSNELTDKNIPNDMTAKISDYAGEEWAKFALKQATSVILELPITAFRPEEMRVTAEGRNFLVQTRRDGGEWITQKAHATEAEAVQDAQSWYPDPSETLDPELKRPERQEEPFAAFLDAYSGKAANPYVLTSDMSDAFVLGRYFAQHGYERPKLIAKSRGDSWRVAQRSAESGGITEVLFSVNGESVVQKSGIPPNGGSLTGVSNLDNEISALVAEITAKGITVPTPSEFMADVDAGRRVGRSKVSIAQDLKEHKKDLAGLKSGTVTARKILGVGGKKEMAEAWLLLQIDACYTALEDGTGFRTLVNMQNYIHILKDALAGKDISPVADSEVKDKQEQEDKELQARIAALEELENKAKQMKNYSVGSLDGMTSPFEVKFTIQGDATGTLVELGELTTPQAKYEFLRDKAQSMPTLVKADKMQFSRKVDLNGAIRKKIAFGHFKIEPRAGYCVATCTIDLEGVQGATGGEPNAESLRPQSEPGFVVTLRDILAGKYDSDTARMGSLLDAAAEEAEKAGIMNEHESLFNQAADHLTATLKKRAA